MLLLQRSLEGFPSISQPGNPPADAEKSLWAAFSFDALEHVCKQVSEEGVLLDPSFFGSMKYSGDVLGQGTPYVPLFLDATHAVTQLKFHMMAAGPNSNKQWNMWGGQDISMKEFALIHFTVAASQWQALHSKAVFGKSSSVAPVYHFQLASQVLASQPGFSWEAVVGSFDVLDGPWLPVKDCWL